MRPQTTDEIIDLLNGCPTTAALGAALELDLFGLLERQGPLDAAAVGAAVGVPGRRCRYWLETLVEAGLLEIPPTGPRGSGPPTPEPAFAPSPVARREIMEVYSAPTWSFLAREARERSSFLDDFARRLRDGAAAGPAPAGGGAPSLETGPEGYVELMARDPERARGFTRMLHEIHLPLAAQVAEALEVGAARRLLDLGGGSGVVSLELLRRHRALSAVVVDIANVCAAGREIAREQGLAERIVYEPGDIMRDELPAGFDLVIECDVDEYGADLFRRVRASLAPGGRFVVVDQLAPAPGFAPRGRLHWALERSLAEPDFAFPTTAEVSAQLAAAGFATVAVRDLPPPPGAPPRFSGAAVMIEAVPEG